jgi:hypothetical protein
MKIKNHHIKNINIPITGKTFEKMVWSFSVGLTELVRRCD